PNQSAGAGGIESARAGEVERAIGRSPGAGIHQGAVEVDGRVGQVGRAEGARGAADRTNRVDRERGSVGDRSGTRVGVGTGQGGSTGSSGRTDGQALSGNGFADDAAERLVQ